MTRVAIYLAGNIKKGHESLNEDFWGDAEIAEIAAVLAPTSIDFLNPAIRSDNLADQKSVFGRDLSQVFCSDVVFVDARQRRGLGVGAEMMWAKMHAIPVVTLCPTESHYRRHEVDLLDMPVKNWVHPFIESLSDHLVETVEAGALWIQQVLVKRSQPVFIKGPSYLHEAMQYYHNVQLQHDNPMQALIHVNERIAAKFHRKKESKLVP
jgi:hypothetical protein